MGGDALMILTKQCSKCGEEKEVTKFSKSSSRKDGRQDYCKSCKSEYNRTHQNRNKTRMFVNGKFVPKSHPLHKPGKYKTFEDAAFSSLEKYESSTEGQVYVITNPNFCSWVKVGMAVEAEDRLNGYQTSSPFRDYMLNYSWDVNDRRAAESEAHSELQKLYERRSEWFKCTPEQAQEVVSGIVGSYQ
jgi:hypothetical protein